MGIVDAFSKEDRIQVKFSDFYKLVKETSKSELMMNALKADVPSEFIIATFNEDKDFEEEDEY